MSLSTLVLRLTHTGVDKDDNPFKSSIFIPDLETGLEYQGRKSAVYVPYEGSITIPVANRVAFSMYSGAIKQFVEDGYLTAETLVDVDGTTQAFPGNGGGGIQKNKMNTTIYGGIVLPSGANTSISVNMNTVIGSRYYIEPKYAIEAYGSTGPQSIRLVITSNNYTNYNQVLNFDGITISPDLYFSWQADSTTTNFTMSFINLAGPGVDALIRDANPNGTFLRVTEID